MARRKRDEQYVKIANELLANNEINNAGDLQAVLKEIMGSAIETMLEDELTEHLDYEKHQSSYGSNKRNGTTGKKVRSSYGEMDIDVPRDREGFFDPIIVEKREKDISDIEDKILKMYARGMSQRDIAQTIEEIYGFDASKDMISRITDKILPEINEWQNRQLQACHPFIFVDCMYVSMKSEGYVTKRAVYSILAYSLDGTKELLGIWFADTESKHEWMSIFDEIKKRGVESIFFIAMDGVSGLEAGAKAIFKDVIVQRCIVHLIRNSAKFIPSKDMKDFSKDLKKVYAAPSLKASESALESLNTKWNQYPGALRVWNDNSSHIFQLYSLGSDVRRIMYTTNAIEAVHSSFRKVTKKGTFESEDSLIKALYLRLTELEKKWSVGKVRHWSMVLNQLMIDDRFGPLIEKYSDN